MDDTTLPKPTDDTQHQGIDQLPTAHAAVAPSSSMSSTPITAADIDLIEKEWVIKAKEIVAATTGDPKRQSIELSKAKRDYISKRFNKELPTRE